VYVCEKGRDQNRKSREESRGARRDVSFPGERESFPGKSGRRPLTCVPKSSFITSSYLSTVSSPAEGDEKTEYQVSENIITQLFEDCHRLRRENVVCVTCYQSYTHRMTKSHTTIISGSGVFTPLNPEPRALLMHPRRARPPPPPPPTHTLPQVGTRG
jgi:hypothetical protein